MVSCEEKLRRIKEIIKTLERLEKSEHGQVYGIPTLRRRAIEKIKEVLKDV